MRSHSLLFWPLWLTSRSSTTWTAGAPMDRPSSSSSGKQLQPVLQEIWRTQTDIGGTLQRPHVKLEFQWLEKSSGQWKKADRQSARRNVTTSVQSVKIGRRILFETLSSKWPVPHYSPESWQVVNGSGMSFYRKLSRRSAPRLTFNILSWSGSWTQLLRYLWTQSLSLSLWYSWTQS